MDKSPSVSDDTTFRQKDMIRQVLDNPLFDSMIKNIRSEMAHAMLNETTEEKRDNIFHESQALDRLVKQLTKIANDVRMERT